MTESSCTNHAADHALVLQRFIAAPPAMLYRAWTDPQWLVKWFAPLPWTVARAELDVRPGGSSLVVMRSPEGEESPNHGVYLDVVPGRRLVLTDAYVKAWEPSNKAFCTISLDFDAAAGGTQYTARVLHWNAADRDAHEAMGFHPGWGQCTDQLAALVAAR